MKFINFPENRPSEPGKYLVKLQCGDRTWTSMKLWEQAQTHRYDGAAKHSLFPQCWILGMEFEDTKVLEFIDEPF